MKYRRNSVYIHPDFANKVKNRNRRSWKPSALSNWLNVVLTGSMAVILIILFAPISRYLQDHMAPDYRPSSSSRNLSYLAPSQMTDAELAHALSDTSSESQGQYTMPTVGIYDVHEIIGSSKPYLRHTFIGWDDTRTLSEELLKTKRLHDVPLVTVEPTDHHSPRLISGPQDKVAGEKLLEGIAGGTYDTDLSNLFKVIRNYHAPVYLRFAQEMDLPNTYPWGNQTPGAYIAAFRYAVNLAKTQPATNNIRWVWSPSGNDDAAAYYPGDDVVDVVGVTVLYSKLWVNGQPSFFDLTRTQQTLSKYHKPLWIAEFGVDNSDRAYQDALIKDAVQHYQDYGFSMLSYMNIGESNPAYKSNDYRLDKLTTFSSIFSTTGHS